MLALLVAPLSFGGAATGDDDIEARDEYGNVVDVQPVDVDELEGSGIMAISAELGEDDRLAPQARIGGTITPFETLIYKVLIVNDHPIVIVGGTLPEGTVLPATIEVAVPAGSPVFWFGEVGETGDPAQDPRFPSDHYTMRTEGDFDIYTAVMTHYLDMQIEYRLSPSPFSRGGGDLYVSLEYTPWQDVDELRLAAALPPGGVAPTAEFIGWGPRDDDGNQSGAFAYIFADAQAGQTYAVDMGFTMTGTGAAVSNIDPGIVIGLIAVLVITASTMFFLFAKTKKPKEKEQTQNAWGTPVGVQVAVEDDENDDDSSDDSEEEGWVCAHCEADVELDSKFCRNCGANLTA